MPDSKDLTLNLAGKEKRYKKKRTFRKHLVHLFLVPAILIYGVFQVYPLISAVINSFYSWQGFNRVAFVGLENFKTLFTQEPFKGTFLNALKHNFIFFIVSVFSELIVAFLLALLINSKIKGAEFFKTIFFLPKLLSVIVIGFLFSLILNPTSGALNSFLNSIGLSSIALPWLGNTSTALITIVLVHSWAGLGFAMLIFLASLQAIDKEILEAAKLDGATGFTLLFKIIIPQVMNAIMIMTILTFIGSFETFDLIYAMQGSSGGPYFSTDVLATFFYRLAFGSAEGGQALGLGSAVAVILFVIISCSTAILLFYFKRKDFER
ncbi:carbohydrate ABC transporter permease [Terrilactibacillus laevilacticus]|uniref:carbohydrate ABC transporter permease n=1 Tax=Terrilactibacillus laevilacticus TaxID=1380157 RepID=UPI00114620E3|nr:sugar ABC transporter permease [Terrilactibacillus laevilacticus]